MNLSYQMDAPKSMKSEGIKARLDEIRLAKEALQPDPKLLSFILERVEHTSLYARFFFHDLENPDWLPLLYSSGLFKRVLQGTTQIPPLLLSHYVVNYCEAYPEEFIGFCEEVKDSYHWMEPDLVRAAIRLPQKHQAQFLKLASKWEFKNLIETEPIRDIVKSQIRRGNVKLALELLSRVTRLRTDVDEESIFRSFVIPRAMMDDHWFSELTRDFLPELVPLAPEEVVRYTGDRLREVVQLQRAGDPFSLPRFGGVAKLAEEGDSGPSGVMEILAYTYRDVLTALGRIDSNQLKKTVKANLSMPEDGALVRASLFAAAECESIRVEVLNHALNSDDLWHDINALPELEHLVRCAWPQLDDDDKVAVTGRTMKLQGRPPIPGRISSEEAEADRKRNVINWLILLEELGLPPRIRNTAIEMRQDYTAATGKKERDDYTGIQIRTIDPVPEEATRFVEWSAERILEYCMKFKPVKDFLYEKTAEGVSRLLQDQVALRPESFEPYGDLIVSLPYPAYHSAVANGYTQALMSGKNVDRAGVGQLCLRLLSQATYLHEEFAGYDFGRRAWVRNSVADFLEEAAQGDPNPLRSQDILFRLWHFMWHGPVDEVKERIQGDPLAAIMNSERGRLSMALCRLGLRVAVEPSLGTPEAEVAKLKEWRTLLFEVIENELLSSDEAVVRGPLGLFFTSFFAVAQDWAERKTNQIFDQDRVHLWEAAWSCHFWITTRYKSVFHHLRPQYEFALGLAHSMENNRVNWVESMGQDFVLFWLTGALESNDPLLQSYWKLAPSSAKRSAIVWVNANLNETTWPEIWPRAKEWWKMAVDSGDSGDPRSLSMFLYWFRVAPPELTVGEVLPLLLASIASENNFYGDHIFDFLEARLAREPRECAEVIHSIAKNRQVHLGVLATGRLKKLMGTLADMGDEDIKKLLESATESLLEAGLFDFYDLPS